ncbi:MAG: hydrogenase nickel incorporation protein HypB [Candidatus Micrarchaeota archaeon]
MCDECGCNEPASRIEVNRSVTEENDAIAHKTWHLLKEKGMLCINVLGAPGSGKTTFIESIVKYIAPSEIAVIEGDLESDIDKERLEKRGVDSYQINTHSGCHLNAAMVNDALGNMNLEGKGYLVIENVGNLVCPAGVKIGQHIDIVVSSTTEGSDKPKKYPIIFMNAELVIISKYDLAEAVGFDEKIYFEDIGNINSKAVIVKTSSKEPGSFERAAKFIVHERDHLLGKGHDH